MKKWHVVGYAGWEKNEDPARNNIDIELVTSDEFSEKDIKFFVMHNHSWAPLIHFQVEELPIHGKTMGKEEMHAFLKAIARDELWQEKALIPSLRKTPELGNLRYGYPRYLKAIRVSLIAQGYDVAWVEGPFRTALENMYWV